MHQFDKQSIQDLSKKYSMKEILDALIETTINEADDCSDLGLKEKAVNLTKLSLVLEATKEKLKPNDFQL